MEIVKSNFTLIMGENSSGKSLFAEDLAVAFDSPRIYLATLVPQTADNDRRIEKHRIQRQDKGFVTIEQAWDIDTLEVSSDAVILLEDVSNLLANGIFMHHKTAADALSQITALAHKCKQLIAVNIAGLTADGYDEETASYINGINLLNQELTSLADAVYLMQAGVPTRLK